MLRGVMTSGTGRSAAIAGRDVAGKTGTTSDYKDAWFVGYTGGFVTAVDRRFRNHKKSEARPA